MELASEKQKYVCLHFFLTSSPLCKGKALKKYRVSTTFGVKTPCGHSTMSEKSLKSSQELKSGSSHQLIDKRKKICTINHPAVFLTGQCHSERKFVTYKRSSLLREFQQMFCFLMFTQGKALFCSFGFPNPNQLLSPFIFSFCFCYNIMAVSVFVVLEPQLKIIAFLDIPFAKLFYLFIYFLLKTKKQKTALKVFLVNASYFFILAYDVRGRYW